MRIQAPVLVAALSLLASTGAAISCSGSATAGSGGASGTTSTTTGGSAGAPGTTSTTTGGSGGASTGTGGASTGSGGASTGTGGASTGSGGASTGTGGASTGSGGASAGTGGASASSSGATSGSGGGGGETDVCTKACTVEQTFGCAAKAPCIATCQDVFASNHSCAAELVNYYTCYAEHSAALASCSMPPECVPAFGNVLFCIENSCTTAACTHEENVCTCPGICNGNAAVISVCTDADCTCLVNSAVVGTCTDASMPICGLKESCCTVLYFLN